MQTYILYTTSKSKEVQRAADIFAEEISQTKGRDIVKIKVKHFRAPKKVETRVSPTSGRVLLSWEWFDSTFKKDSNDAVIFHFLPAQRRRWGIAETIGGERRVPSKEYPNIWICDDLSTRPAPGYEDAKTSIRSEVVTDFLRKLFHEQSHFDEDLDDQLGNVLVQDSVHDFDYRLKMIHQYHYLVDYRGLAFKKAVNRLTVKIIKLANQIF